MEFLCCEWTAPQLLDPSLISMPLRIRHEEICSVDVVEDVRSSREEEVTRESPTAPTSSRYGIRILEEHRAMLGDTRPRKDLITEYARRGEKLFGMNRGATSERVHGQTASRRELVRKTLEDIRWMKGTQRELVEGAERERTYVDSLATESPRDVTSSLQISPSIDRVERLYEREVRGKEYKESREIKKNWSPESQIKPREYGMRIHRKSPIRKDDEPLFSPRESSSTTTRNRKTPLAERTSTDGELEDLEQDDDFSDVDVSEMNKVLPQIEPLDLSQLSPPPTVGRRIQKEKSIDTTASPKIQYIAVPEWLRLLPLDGTSSVRAPLLQYPLSQQGRKAFTERASQTCISPSKSPKDKVLISPADSGFHSRHTISKVLLINQLSPNAARNVLDSME